MTPKIAIVTDTNACLDYIDHSYDIPILRSIIHLGDQEYIDFVELNAEQFYQKLKEDSSIDPKTSQPSNASMIEVYQSLLQKKYTDVIVVTISSKMSGIYGSAQVAAKAVPGITVHVFDSKSVAYAQAKMVLTAARMIEKNQSVSTILNALEVIRDNNHIYFAVDTLKYLVKNGRLSNAQGMVGSMFKIKPLLHVSDAGQVESVEKIRTFTKAVDRVIERYLEETAGKNVEPFICHANNPTMRDYITNQLKAHDATIDTVFSMPLTPAVGAHSGPGAIGLGYIVKTD